MSKIEWTGATWNPGVYGCAEVSPGCANCYAAKMAHRQVAMGNYPAGITEARASGVHWTGKIVVADELQRLEVLPKLKPSLVFVNSMSDLFHADVPSEFIHRVFDEMAARQHLTFQVLTKRPRRMAEFAREIVFAGRGRGPDAIRPVPWSWPKNVWAGATVEDQKRAEDRVEWLLKVPARVRFLSVEPMLGPIDLRLNECHHEGAYTEPDTNATICEQCHDDGEVDWVIAGGESGGRARPSHPDWFRSLRDQCQSAGVPFFFKQWGEWAPGNGGAGGDLYDRARKRHDRTFGKGSKGTGTGVRSGFFDYNDNWNELGPNPFRQTMDRVGKAAAGRQLDGVVHAAFPELA